MNGFFARSHGVLLVCLLLLGAPARSQDGGQASAIGAPDAELTVDAVADSRDVLEAIRGSGMELTADRAAEIAASSAAAVDHADALLATAQAGAARALYGFVPRLDVAATYARIPTNEDRLVPNSVTRDIDAVADPAARDLWDQHARIQKDRYSFQATVTLPVSDYFLELWPRYESAQGFVEAREYGVEAERARVELAARRAYYAHARARAALAVRKRALEQAEHAARLVEIRARQGHVIRADALKVRAEVASARAALVQSEGGVDIAGTALRTLLDIEPGTPIALSEDLLEELPPNVEKSEVLMKRAIESRAETRALRRLVEASGRAVDAAKGSRLPSLVLQGHAEVGSPNSRVFLERSDPIATGYVSLGLLWSLGETLEGGPAADEYRASRSRARADLRMLEGAIRTEIAGARGAYETALQMREAAKLEYEAALENHRMRVAEFTRGHVVTTDVIAAVTALAHAELNLLSVAIDGRVALAELERAVGGGEVTVGQ